MATLTISQYDRLAEDGRGNTVLAGLEPAFDVADVDFTAGEAKSAQFDKRANFVRLHTDVACRFLFGTDPAVTTSTGAPMVAGQTEMFGVGGSIKVSVVAA